MKGEAMGDVRHWLNTNGLAQLTEIFEREQIDLDALKVLTESNLKDLGLPMGPRAKLLAAIQRLKDSNQLPPPRPPIGVPAPAADRENPAIAGERRQLTVLFCDMVGFTELANRIDPEILDGIVRSYEDACAVCITRYEGYVY